jgi:diguanylate cyclase (GGDEF)-like protein
MSQVYAIAPKQEAPFAPESNPVVRGLADELIQTLRTDPGSFGPRTWTLIQAMMAYAAEAEQKLSEQSARIDYLESLSMTDELTGLLNRRGFSDMLARTLREARRHDEHGLLVFIDLDDFKAINDTFGHEAGDAVLKGVAEHIESSVRSTDFVARLGGDEFAILYVRGDLLPTQARAERLKASLNELRVKHRNLLLPVRGSFGMCGYSPASALETLMREADRAMYRDKRKRRAARR